MTSVILAGTNSFYNKNMLSDGVIHWSEAKEHVGENVTIYGEVASTFFDAVKYDRECEMWAAYPEIELKVPPTFIEIGAVYPNKEVLKIVIWGRDRNRFPQPPDIFYRGNTLLISGQPYLYNDMIHVNVTSPNQLKVVNPVVGLYDGWGPTDANCGPVFESEPATPDDSQQEESWYEEEYVPREPEYYDHNTGKTVSKLGDYFYDDEGNCIPDGFVSERYDDWW